MKIKEFSQKHSVTLFWTSIVLFIVSVSLCTFLCCNKSQNPRGLKQNFNRNMIQNDGGSRSGNFKNRGDLPDRSKQISNDQNDVSSDDIQNTQGDQPVVPSN